MKKNIFGVALITAMAVAAGWNFNQSKKETKLSDLAMANVEALANIEWGEPCIFSPFVCYVIYDEFGWDTIFGDEM